MNRPCVSTQLRCQLCRVSQHVDKRSFRGVSWQSMCKRGWCKVRIKILIEQKTCLFGWSVILVSGYGTSSAINWPLSLNAQDFGPTRRRNLVFNYDNHISSRLNWRKVLNTGQKLLEQACKLQQAERVCFLSKLCWTPIYKWSSSREELSLLSLFVIR